MKDYLNTYGVRRHSKFQMGGPMPAEGGMPPEGGAPAEGGGGDPQAEIIALAEAAAAGDMEAAAQLGMMVAPLILEQAGGAGGGAPAGPEGGAPVFRKGGRLIRK